MKRQSPKCKPLVPYQVSKWQNLSCNLTKGELESLYADLGKPAWILCGKVFSLGEKVEEGFPLWLEKFVQGEVLPALLTRSPEAYTRLEFEGGKFLIQPRTPLIQVKEHRIVVASDNTIHSGVFGPDSIPFGITFSYPQIFLDPEENRVVEVGKSAYPNTALFKELQKWVRNYTRPTAFLIGGEKKVFPFRTGKERPEVGVL